MSDKQLSRDAFEGMTPSRTYHIPNAPVPVPCPKCHHPLDADGVCRSHGCAVAEAWRGASQT